MSAYHQMGHNSENLVLEVQLNQFSGVLLSPVNYSLEKTIKQCEKFRSKKSNLDIIFDPQLYIPSSEQLLKWPHNPSDLNTADKSSFGWWQAIVINTIKVCLQFKPEGLCTPAFIPRAFDDNYYDLIVEIGNFTAKQLKITTSDQDKIRPLLTALIDLNDLGRTDRYLEVSSILSKFSEEDIYLIFTDDVIPRRERSDSSALEDATKLIYELSNAGFLVTVGFTSSEMILWKAAGATNVATGKFFNLRRFSKDRWKDDTSIGGRQIPYWFEPALLAFIREVDIKRYKKILTLDPSHMENPFSKSILKKIGSPGREAWLADSWQQFMFWFAQCEAIIGNDLNLCSNIVTNARATWKDVKKNKIMFEEEDNDGSWLRAWEIALNELNKL